MAADTTPVFNIKAVVTQTGLKPATIRAWERRYGFPQPSRSAGGHRQYSQRDIDTLKWLIARQEEGVSISHAVELWRSHIERGENPLANGAAGEPAAPLAPIAGGDQIDQLRQAWIAACLAFDRETAEQILVRAFALFTPETVCLELLQRGLAEVGSGWYTGDVTVQQEHFTSALSVQRLETLIASTPPPTRSERIIVATAPGDYHVFSPLLLTYLLRRQGWDVIYLGADVPAAELATTVDQVRPELVVMSAQLLHTAAALQEVAISLRRQDIPLAFGGAAFNVMTALRTRLPGHFLGPTLPEAVGKVAELINRRPAVDAWQEPTPAYQAALAHYRRRRPFIESQVWDIFNAGDQPTAQLAAVNEDVAQTITAALKLGDAGLLGADVGWLEHLLMGHRLASTWLDTYVAAYQTAAAQHLDETAGMIVDWLSHLRATTTSPATT